MEHHRQHSTHKTNIILGLTLVFGAVFLSNSEAQTPQIVTPLKDSATTLQSNTTSGKSSLTNAALETKTIILLTDVLNAAKSNLDVSIARSQTQTAQGDLLAADHAPVPVLSSKASQMDLQNGLGSGSIFNDKRIDKSIGLDWTWERGDKRTLRTQTAKNLLSAAQFDLSDTLVGQQILAYQAFIDLFAAQLKEEEFLAIAENYQKTNETASIRLKNGDLSAQDAFRISIENQRAQADAQAAKLERQNAALALSQLVKLNTSPLSWRIESGFKALISANNNPIDIDNSNALIESATLARPDVIAALEREKAARIALDLALSLKKTDLTWGASIDHYPGTSNRLVELRVQLPLQVNYSYDGEIKRAQEQLKQAQLMLEKIKLLAATELQSLFQSVLTSSDRYQRYETIILPQSKKVLDQAEFAYSKGAMTLTDLLDARRTFRSTRIESIASQAELSKSQGAWFLRTEPFRIEQLSTIN